MRAIVSETPGGPDSLTLREIPEPEAGIGQVVISVDSCSINFPDVLIIQDLYQIKPPRPFVPGAEVSGIVTRIGTGVSRFQIGDRVCGRAIWGGLAQKLAIDERRCYALPADMSFEIGAGFLFTYGTAYYALKNRAALAPGETVLILGAAGGVGAASIELAKAMDARVVAATSSPEKAAMARDLGADETLCYPPTLDRAAAREFTAALKERCGPRGADVIVDPVGGDYAEAAIRAIGPGGRHLVVGFTAGIPALPLNLTLLKSCQVMGVNWATFVRENPEGDAANTEELFDLYSSGRIRPRVTREYSLEDAATALSELAERRAKGKLVVRIGGASVDCV